MRVASLAVALSLAASSALAQPGGVEAFPEHPGGHIELRAIRSGPLTADEVAPALAPLVERLRSCAVARARARSEPMAASFGFEATVAADGRVTATLDPAPDASRAERAWLRCAQSVVRRMRLPAADAPSVLSMTLIWARDDVPHGSGLL